MSIQLESKGSIIYRSFRTGFQVISHIFFREIKTSNAHLVPSSGPCIFIVGPHANQFVDGIVFLSNNPRPSYVLMASVSYEKPLIGHVGKILNAIPVVRPQDIINKGTGRVFYDPVSRPFEIRGDENTRFTTELGVRDFVIFGRNFKAHVARIISDHLLEITHALPAADQEMQKEGYEFTISPHVDQTAVYDEVYHYLNNGECVTIFPEGGSHDRTEMLPLKAGFAIMALGAAAANPALDIKIVPVGLNYFHPDRFRSRAVVSFGQPISIDRTEVEKYKKGGKEKREAVTQLLDQSDEAFKAITVNVPDYDTLMLIQAARRLYVPRTNEKPSIEQVVRLNSRFVSLWSKLKNDPKLEVIVRKVRDYNGMLRFFGIRDHQVDKLNITPLKAGIQLVKKVFKLIVMVGLGSPALISNLPLIWITSYISKKKQEKALAGSSVKIAGKDVLATWKVIVAAFAAPALYLFYASLYLLYLLKRRPQLSPKSKFFRTGCAWVIQPILHYFLMRLGDNGIDVYRSIKPLFLAIRNPEAGQVFRSIRKELSQDITEFINQHEPEFELDKNNAISSVDSSPVESAISISGNEQNIAIEHSFLGESVFTITTTDGDMQESYLTSEDYSLAGYSSSQDYDDEYQESKYQIESIVLEENEEEGEGEKESQLLLEHV